MTEIWRDIKGYDGLYQVSNIGRVKSFHKGGRILKSYPDHKGYLLVGLHRDSKNNHAFVHRLVAQAFIPNPDGKPQVNHINGDKSDNRVENLEWVTSSENQQHAYDTGLRGSNGDNPLAKLTDAQVVYIRNNPDNLSGVKLAQVFGVDQTTISLIQRGKTYCDAGGRIRDRIDTRIPDEIRERIRAEYKPGVRGCSTHALARKFGFSQRTILNIINEN